MDTGENNKKICITCHRVKLLNDFAKIENHYLSKCKECVSIAEREKRAFKARKKLDRIYRKLECNEEKRVPVTSYITLKKKEILKIIKEDLGYRSLDTLVEFAIDNMIKKYGGDFSED